MTGWPETTFLLLRFSLLLSFAGDQLRLQWLHPLLFFTLFRCWTLQRQSWPDFTFWRQPPLTPMEFHLSRALPVWGLVDSSLCLFISWINLRDSIHNEIPKFFILHVRSVSISTVFDKLYYLGRSNVLLLFDFASPCLADREYLLSLSFWLLNEYMFCLWS